MMILPMTSNDDYLTTREAFRALYLYLEAYWQEVPNAELAVVANDISPGIPEQAHDPATWEEWLEAVQRVRAERRRGGDPAAT
jgi:hypothetical protein